MSLAQTAENLANDLAERARRAADLVEEKIDAEIFPPPSDEPLTWEREGLTKGVIPAHVPKVAAQLYFGYIVQRVLPRIMANRIQKLREMAEDFLLKRLGELALGQASRSAGVVRFLVDALAIYEETQIQRAIYDALTGKSLDYQRELLTLKLTAKTNAKKRERVYTRHPSPKQRRPNGSK